MKIVLKLAQVVVLLAAGFMLARKLFPVIVPGIPIIVTDTVFVDHFDVDTIIEVREHVITDTFNIIHEVTISEPVYMPLPDMPRMRGVTRVEVGQNAGDTTLVSIVDIWPDSGQVATQAFIQKLYTPGPLLYLEASDPMRYDFGTFPESDSCGLGCKLLWYGAGLASGVVVWELAR